MSASPATSESAHWLRDVVLFLSGQSMSLFGSAIVGYSVVWYVTLKTGSSSQYALLVIMSSLAMAMTTIPGGIWADRYWRKGLMIGADTGVAIATMILAVVMLSGYESIWLIALILALRGLGGGIQSPSVGAALPQVAPTDKLLRINSINQAIQAMIQVAAPALAAVLLMIIPLGWILMIDVVTAIIGITFTVFVRIPRLPHDPDLPAPEGLKGYVSHTWEAARYALAIPGLRRTFLLVVLLMAVVIPYPQMTPVFVVRLFGSEQWMLATVEITWSLGMVIGGLAIAAWGGLRNRMTMIMISCAIMTITTMAMGFMPNIWTFVAVMAIQGLSLPMMNTPAITVIQETIPEAMMGRVMSFIMLINGICAPLGMAIIGPVADYLHISWMALVCGTVALAIIGGLAIRGGPGAKLYRPEKPLDQPLE
jgi:DHA3 family macrolide efflux protein-like MFS transporter